MSVNSPIIIVLPCLNEEHYLTHTCNSLGFGIGKDNSPANCYLIIVDNDSIDGTLDVAKRIAEKSRDESVIICQEHERGYIPPRHTGNLTAYEFCGKNGWDPSLVLILQADADSKYAPGYINEMWEASFKSDKRTLVEGLMTYSPSFMNLYSNVINKCIEIDQLFSDLYLEDQNDIIVTDMACGYRLETYFAVGEHKREFTQHGDEIHAETSRLFIKIRSQGGQRIKVENAQVEHSERRFLEEPIFQIATAGFPREKAWKHQWEKMLRIPLSIKQINENLDHPSLDLVFEHRKQHALALFTVLPCHILKTLEPEEYANRYKTPFSKYIASLLPSRTALDVENSPGSLIMDVFDLLSTHGEKLLTHAYAALQNPAS